MKQIELDNNLEKIIFCALKYACENVTDMTQNICDFIEPLILYISGDILYDMMKILEKHYQDTPDDWDSWIHLYTIIHDELSEACVDAETGEPVRPLSKA